LSLLPLGAVLLSYQCFINSLIKPRAEKKNEPQEWREWTRDLSLLPFGFCLATNVSFFQLVRKVQTFQEYNVIVCSLEYLGSSQIRIMPTILETTGYYNPNGMTWLASLENKTIMQ